MATDTQKELIAIVKDLQAANAEISKETRGFYLQLPVQCSILHVVN